ncbi:MAG: hypothetical protein U0Z26_14015 [Anaerolineales bacterium]
MTTRKQIDSQEETLDALEAHLAGTLKRVAPPSGIVHRLRERIHIPQREVIASRLRDWRTLFFVFGGVMSGMLALVTIARALYHVVGRRN